MHKYQIVPTEYKPFLSPRGLAPWASATNFVFVVHYLSVHLGSASQPGRLRPRVPLSLSLIECLFSICLACIYHFRARGFCHCISMGCFNQERNPPFMHMLDVRIFMHILYIYVYVYVRYQLGFSRDNLCI